MNNQTTQDTTVPQIYRHGSTYQAIFEILYRHSYSEVGGISRDKLLEEVKVATRKDEKLLRYSISIICSSESLENGGTAHKSCRAEHYWVEKDGSFLTLRMREPSLV